jgi:hypothetical protein
MSVKQFASFFSVLLGIQFSVLTTGIVCYYNFLRVTEAVLTSLLNPLCFRVVYLAWELLFLDSINGLLSCFRCPLRCVTVLLYLLFVYMRKLLSELSFVFNFESLDL